MDCVADNDANCGLLEADSDDDPDMPFYMTTSFACGEAFSDSVLDTIVVADYFNEDVQLFLSQLVNGGVTAELECYLADEVGLQPPTEPMTDRQLLKLRNRCRVGHVEVKRFVSAILPLSSLFGSREPQLTGNCSQRRSSTIKYSFWDCFDC